MTRPRKIDAWMPLWVGDYLADTTHLTRDQHGCYLLLLMAYWRNGGPLPDDDDRLASIVKASKKEWRQLRPAVIDFFVVDRGHLRQKRADEELAVSAKRAQEASSKASAAANARWGKQSSDAPSNAPSNAPSTTQAKLELCPPPSPSPSTGTPTDVAEDKNKRAPQSRALERQSSSQLLPGGEACRAMSGAGLTDAVPSHPKLIALLNQGVSIAELVSASEAAVKQGKGFAYALATAAGRRRDATAVHAPHSSAAPTATQDPDTKANLEYDAKRLGVAGWDPTKEQYPQFAARVRAARAAEKEGVSR